MTTDLTRYRKTSKDNRDFERKPHPDAFWSDKYGWLEEDDSLQDIADAWDGSWQKEIRELSWELAGLLDGLVNDVTEGEPVAPDQDPNHPNYMGEPT